MSFISRAFERLRPPPQAVAGALPIAERPEPRFFASDLPESNLSDPADWFLTWAAGGSAGSFGPAVSERTAMACSAVYRCVSLLSGLIANLPLKVYSGTDDDGREEARDHRIQPMLKVAPFPGRPMTAFTWREQWGSNVLLHGNHYSAIRYDRAARVIGFEPAMPWSEVYRKADRNLYRLIFIGDGGVERYEWLDQDDVIHIPGLGFNGVTGVSRIRANARDSIALSQMLLEQIGRVHENSARPSMFVPVPSGLSSEGLKRFKAQFNSVATGRVNAGTPVFGDRDYKPEVFQMTPEDLNTIDLMRFTVADISRFFGVPLHLLNETDKSTSWGSGLAEQTLAFLIFSFNPDLQRIEAELNYKLFNGTGYFCEFDRDALMEMDPVRQSEVAQREIGSGVLLMDEYRKKKNRPPLANGLGSRALVNSTNVPLEKIFEPGAQPRQDPLQVDPLGPRPDLGSPDGSPGNPAGDNTAAKFAEVVSPIVGQLCDMVRESLQANRESSAQIIEAIAKMPAPTVNVTVPKAAGTLTKVTKKDEHGRIEEFERHPIEAE